MEDVSTTSTTLTHAVGKYGKLTIAGFVIGAANLIPGVSGGTMALLLGVYERLIESIRAVSDVQWLRDVLRGQWRSALDRLPWQFLLAIGVGGAASVLTLTHFLEWVFETYPVQVEAFFFGLVAASIFTVARRVRRWGPVLVIAVIVGALGAWFMVDLAPAQTPDTPLFFFISAVLAVGTMVLPGISGAFVLILLGQYQYALSAVTTRNFLRLALLGLGGVLGLVTISRVLSWLFEKQHDLTLALLAGMVAGSLRKLWPWKETYFDVVGELLGHSNILPTAWTPEVGLAVALALAGFVLVLALGRKK